MRTSVLTVFLWAAAAMAQMPIKVPLPCETTTQEISPSGKYVAVRCKDKNSYVLEVPGGKTVASLSANDNFRTFAFSPDDRWLAAGNRDGEVAVVSIGSNEGPKKWSAGTSNIEFVKFIGPGELVVSPVRGPAAVWDVSSAPVIKTKLDTDFASITAADVSPDGKMLVTTGADTVVRFYDTTSWKKIHEYRELLLEPFAAAFSADGKYAIVGGADGQLTILDASTGQKTKALPAQPDPIQAIRTLGSSRLCVLYFDADGRKPPHLMVWDINSGTSRSIGMGENVTGGAVVKGMIWLASASPNELELRLQQ